MVNQKIVIRIKFGLHARPAGVLAKIAQQFASDVKVVIGEKEYNAKSIMGLLAAGIQNGTEIQIRCTGEDEIKALHAIIPAIESGLGE